MCNTNVSRTEIGVLKVRRATNVENRRTQSHCRKRRLETKISVDKHWRFICFQNYYPNNENIKTERKMGFLWGKMGFQVGWKCVRSIHIGTALLPFFNLISANILPSLLV